MHTYFYTKIYILFGLNIVDFFLPRALNLKNVTAYRLFIHKALLEMLREIVIKVIFSMTGFLVFSGRSKRNVGRKRAKINLVTV